MTWTPDSIETWRDSSVLFGHNFETNHYFDRDSIHARRDMSVLFGQIFLTTRYFDRDSIHARRDMSFIFGLIIKSFTMMTWTPHLTHGWRDMSFKRRLMKAVVHQRSRRRLYFSPRLSLSTAIPRRKHPVSSAPGSLSYVGPG